PLWVKGKGGRNVRHPESCRVQVPRSKNLTAPIVITDRRPAPATPYWKAIGTALRGTLFVPIGKASDAVRAINSGISSLRINWSNYCSTVSWSARRRPSWAPHFRSPLDRDGWRRCTLHFLRPACMDDVLEIVTRAGAVKGASIISHQRVMPVTRWTRPACALRLSRRPGAVESQ